MRIYSLRDTINEIEYDENTTDVERSSVFVATSKEATKALKMADMVYDGQINLSDISLCRVEAQQECMMGMLCIPKLKDVLNSRYRIQFFINEDYIVLIDDEGFSNQLIRRIRMKKHPLGFNREQFLYHFMTQFISMDMRKLAKYERRIMDLESDVIDEELDEIADEIMPIRRELLTLRSYYDELMDLGKELEEDESEFFHEEQLIYFGTISDRADRLMSKTQQLLEYAQQVQAAYQSKLDEEQSANMRFLTIISTIFMPLTLITSWYGMNFQDMPELQHGYPFVIGFSLLVIVGVIYLFKRRKIF